MAKKKISPLQAGFWLSEQEKRYILVICAVFMLGLIARYYYMKQEKTGTYMPPDPAQTEQNHE